MGQLPCWVLGTLKMNEPQARSRSSEPRHIRGLLESGVNVQGWDVVWDSGGLSPLEVWIGFLRLRQGNRDEGIECEPGAAERGL